MRSEGSQGGWSSSARRVLSVAAAVAVALAGAACDPGPGDQAQTGPAPPDRLTVTAEGGGIDRRLLIDGTISGDTVHAVLERRTDCEIAAYDAAARAVGL